MNPIPLLGATYSPTFDADRLHRQQRLVYDLMQDGQKRTLRAIADATGAPEASASARLRDLRRIGLDVRRERAAPGGGTWLYWIESQ